MLGGNLTHGVSQRLAAGCAIGFGSQKTGKSGLSGRSEFALRGADKYTKSIRAASQARHCPLCCLFAIFRRECHGTHPTSPPGNCRAYAGQPGFDRAELGRAGTPPTSSCSRAKARCMVSS